VLALLAPALAPARDARFRFCFFAWIVCFLVAIDAPPFSQLLQHVPPFGVIVNRRLLGAVALFGALLAAAAWDGLATLDEGRRRGLVVQIVAVVSAVLVGFVLYDASRLSDRPGIALLPDLLPPKLGDAVASVRAPSYNATVRGDRIEVTGFALSVEPPQRLRAPRLRRRSTGGRGDQCGRRPRRSRDPGSGIRGIPDREHPREIPARRRVRLPRARARDDPGDRRGSRSSRLASLGG
jgi:hypothetical protein